MIEVLFCKDGINIEIVNNIYIKNLKAFFKKNKKAPYLVTTKQHST